ncbi:LuxR C-terminal-related transcriptional regulator [Herbiconiux sp. CPCC 203407]|uniref:LuxR C-terminal-related transcriptional regulator n=1 Tax=Herbiconiux oxytropis TaxID=2970915 RepID=A0AA41XFP6_9MICO|nr:LuxR C-terminal-related transcriptional regulator [Herbiconiux oxytropis]MCS5722040.1 LuxR C-terminal-related transcriptional regulator [Herbiconiux oxytropis]MCS5725623.1 LuxR C-terminal-related transcriptional regulator [Herbiconiux oxytropis]
MIDVMLEALACGDVGRARSALRKNWLRLILESRTRELEQVCLSFPDEQDAHILLIRACCRDLSGDPYGAEFLRGQGLRVAADDFVSCFTDLLLAPDTPTKAAVADRAHRALVLCEPEDDYPSALFLLGWTEIRLRRDFPRAIGLLRSASDEAQLQGRMETFRLAQSNLAFALTHAGEFTEAERLLEALPVREAASDWDRFEGGLPQANRGCIAFWRGDFEEAITQFDSIIVEGSPGTDFEALARLYLVLSLIALNREDRYHSAGRTLDGVSAADKHGIPWDTLRRVAAAWLAHAQGRDEQARSIARPALTRTGAAVAHALLAELYRVLEDPVPSNQALRLAAAAGLPRYARVSTLVTSAASNASAGRGRQAHDQVERALETALPERIIAPFLAADHVLTDLLNAHALHGSTHHEFLRTILERRARLSTQLAGVLTKREKEILTYLRTPMTADEIAAQLSIAYPTVKSHIRSIYRKLGVTTRRGAIQAADNH